MNGLIQSLCSVRTILTILLLITQATTIRQIYYCKAPLHNWNNEISVHVEWRFSGKEKLCEKEGLQCNKDTSKYLNIEEKVQLKEAICETNFVAEYIKGNGDYDYEGEAGDRVELGEKDVQTNICSGLDTWFTVDGRRSTNDKKFVWVKLTIDPFVRLTSGRYWCLETHGQRILPVYMKSNPSRAADTVTEKVGDVYIERMSDDKVNAQANGTAEAMNGSKRSTADEAVQTILCSLATTLLAALMAIADVRFNA